MKDDETWTCKIEESMTEWYSGQHAHRPHRPFVSGSLSYHDAKSLNYIKCHAPYATVCAPVAAVRFRLPPLWRPWDCYRFRNSDSCPFWLWLRLDGAHYGSPWISVHRERTSTRQCSTIFSSAIVEVCPLIKVRITLTDLTNPKKQCSYHRYT